jgi:hypothetical protein
MAAPLPNGDRTQNNSKNHSKTIQSLKNMKCYFGLTNRQKPKAKGKVKHYQGENISWRRPN